MFQCHIFVNGTASFADRVGEKLGAISVDDYHCRPRDTIWPGDSVSHDRSKLVGGILGKRHDGYTSGSSIPRLTQDL